jgi:hypothetical protein
MAETEVWLDILVDSTPLSNVAVLIPVSSPKFHGIKIPVSVTADGRFSCSVNIIDLRYASIDRPRTQRLLGFV